MATYRQKVKLVFVSYGSRENGVAAKANVEALREAASIASFTNLRIPLTNADVAAKPLSICTTAVREIICAQFSPHESIPINQLK